MNEHTKAGIDRYVQHGIIPGDFLRAVLSNDLKESFGRADLENRRDMFEIVQYLYNNVPSVCWGSPEKVASWIEFKSNERNAKAAKPHCKGCNRVIEEDEMMAKGFCNDCYRD